MQWHLLKHWHQASLTCPKLGDIICLDFGGGAEILKGRLTNVYPGGPEINGEHTVAWEAIYEYAIAIPFRTSLEKAALQIIPFLGEQEIPEPSHEGSCGPEARCDGTCVDRVHASEYNHRVQQLKHAVANPDPTITKLLQAVGYAASVFRSYEAKHLEKGTEEGNRKAEANALAAKKMEEAAGIL